MKSIKANYIKQIQKNPNKGNYICLAEAITGKKFSRKSILKAFKDFLTTADYDRRDKKKLIHHLYRLSNPNEAGEI